MSEKERLPLSQIDLDALLNPQGQKGVQWRMQKLAAIRRLVKDDKSKAWVVWFLRTRTGLTLPTARGLVEDAFLEEPKGETNDLPRALYHIASSTLINVKSRKTREGLEAAKKKERAHYASYDTDMCDRTWKPATCPYWSG